VLAGHYTAAFVAKGLEPKLPFWVLLVAVQAVDIGWALLVMAGIERVTLDPSLPSNPLVLEYMPYTHSLPATLVWCLAAYAITRARFGSLRRSSRAALLVAAAVGSHWLGDLIVHRPDLGLWGDSYKVGFALWNWPLASYALEVGLLALSAAYAARALAIRGLAVWPPLSLAGLLFVVQTGASFGGTPGDPSDGGEHALVVSALAGFVIVAAAGWAAERAGQRGEPA